MYSNLKLCKFKATKKCFPYHYNPLLYNTDTTFTVRETFDLITFYNNKGICNFLAAHPQGICLYECRGVGVEAANVGCIENTQGFYYVVQDADDPYLFLALARQPLSNIVTFYEDESPQQIDLNPPPHHTSGLYRINGDKIDLIKPLIPDLLLGAFLFKGIVYYMHHFKIYAIINNNPRPYMGKITHPKIQYYGDKIIFCEGALSSRRG